MGLFDFLKLKPINGNSNSKVTINSKGSIKTESGIENRENMVLPIEKRIKGKKPECDGLYPHEVLVLSYASKYFDKENDFQGFWWYKYGIRDELVGGNHETGT